MLPNVDEVQKLSREQVDCALKSFGAANKGLQAIAVEIADQSRSTFESGTAAFEKLLAARTVTAAVAAQSEYAKASYEDLLARSRRIGDLFAETVKESMRPYEQAFRGVTATAAE